MTRSPSGNAALVRCRRLPKFGWRKRHCGSPFAAAARSPRRQTYGKQVARQWLEVENRGTGRHRRARAGGSGWAYAPCQAPAASASQPVSPGDTVYFVIDTRTGRLRSVVSNSPLDGFAPDGTALCPRWSTWRVLFSDLAGSAADLAGGTAADLTSAGTADGGSDKPLPGIHCDCQLASTPKTHPGQSYGGSASGTAASALRSRRSRR